MYFQAKLNLKYIFAIKDNYFDADSAQKYAQIFEDIGRITDLYKYYHRCHKVCNIKNFWSAIVIDLQI